MVLEMGGSSVRAGMGQPDPFLKRECQFKDSCCIQEGQNCWSSNVVYSLTCKICGAIYCGTTARSIHLRTLEHMKAVSRGDRTYSMAKHML